MSGVPSGVAWLGLTALLCLGALVVASAGPLQGGLVDPATVRSGLSATLDWRPGWTSLAQTWRLWTCAWVHWSAPHLLVNLLGAVVVGAVGWRARAPGGAALAWFIAWPLTHLLMDLPAALGLPSQLLRYGGLSGVLHAGVIVLGLSLAWPAAFSRRSDDIGGHAPDEADAADAVDFSPTQSSLVEPSRITEGPWAMTGLDELSTLPSATQGRRADARLAPLTPAQARRHRWIGLAILAGTLCKVVSETPWDPALRPNAMLGIQVAPLAHACGIVAGALAWAAIALAWHVRGSALTDTTAAHDSHA